LAPPGVILCAITTERETWRVGSNELSDGIMSLPSLQQDQNATLAVQYTAASKELERSRLRKSECMCSNVTGGRRGRFKVSGTVFANPCLALLSKA
jgi:hypothetical protein